MSNQTTIEPDTKTDAELKFVPLAELTLSKLNPRQGDLPEAQIDSLAQSIRLCGLIQNLSGLQTKGGKIEIVAGGRRLRALTRLAQIQPEHPALVAVPVKVTKDALRAEAWASAENTARADLEPAEEIRAYARMANTGIDAATIATAFCVTEAHVKRRMKLSQLPEAVLDALDDKTINLDTAQAFTTCNDAKRIAETLALIESGEITHQNALQRALHPEQLRESDRRVMFIGLDAYEAAGGKLTRDLFSEAVYLDDHALVERLYLEKLDAEVKRIEATGWRWVESIIDDCHIPYSVEHSAQNQRVYPIEGVLSEADAEEYDSLCEIAETDDLDEAKELRMGELEAIQNGDYSDEQRAVAGGWLYVNRHGIAKFEGGVVRKEDKALAIEAEVIEKRDAHSGADGGADSATEAKSPISDALRGDLSAMVTGARQTALLADPQLALELLAFQLSGQLGYSRAFGLHTYLVSNHPSTETGYVLDERITSESDDHADDAGKAFAKFRKLGHDAIITLLHEQLTSLFSVTDRNLAALIEKNIKPNTRDVFTPTAENFFKRVNAAYLHNLWCELLEIAPDHPTATSFAKLKKGEKADKLEQLFNDQATRDALKLTKAQQTRIAKWLPEGMT